MQYYKKLLGGEEDDYEVYAKSTFDENKKVLGGHEITIVGYEQDANGKGVFVCNDTDDDLNQLIKMPEAELIPLIHHAGISKEALSKDDVISVPWREILDEFQQFIKTSK